MGSFGPMRADIYRGIDMIRGGARPKILVWQDLTNLSAIGISDCGRYSSEYTAIRFCHTCNVMGSRLEPPGLDLRSRAPRLAPFLGHTKPSNI